MAQPASTLSCHHFYCGVNPFLCRIMMDRPGRTAPPQSCVGTSIRPSVRLSVNPSVRLYVRQSASLRAPPGHAACLPACMSVCLPACAPHLAMLRGVHRPEAAGHDDPRRRVAHDVAVLLRVARLRDPLVEQRVEAVGGHAPATDGQHRSVSQPGPTGSRRNRRRVRRTGRSGFGRSASQDRRTDGVHQVLFGAQNRALSSCLTHPPIGGVGG
jgi:hypothetical protein